MIDIPRELPPPPGLDRKIAHELRRQGLLRRRPTFAYLAAAAALVVLVVWFVRPAPPAPNYILLLYESPRFTGGNRAEYGQWARQMRPLIVGGEELGSQDVFANVPEPAPKLAGYFLIDAADDAGAMRVARACPHLRHGGAVVLRKIVQ
ncbi:MAG TPA: hypothetical protein VKB93_01255 [Thermoanaerobaculia bacterium]|nr:hypothetical protein [Thermoanaerobaculia bacterium]